MDVLPWTCSCSTAQTVFSALKLLAIGRLFFNYRVLIRQQFSVLLAYVVTEKDFSQDALSRYLLRGQRH